MLSIVVPVLDSHEVVRRHVLHYSTLNLKDVEVIFVDDGSTPPLEIKETKHIKLIHTNDFRPWTHAVARNTGAKAAKGNFLAIVDVDHILTQGIIDAALWCSRNKVNYMRYNREFAVLDEHGQFTQDLDTLIEYGLPKERVKEHGAKLHTRDNQTFIDAELYWDIGGNDESLAGENFPQKTDGSLNRRIRKAQKEGKVYIYDDVVDTRPILYMFPTGKFCGDIDYNPKGLFHSLSRKR